LEIFYDQWLAGFVEDGGLHHSFSHKSRPKRFSNALSTARYNSSSAVVGRVSWVAIPHRRVPVFTPWPLSTRISTRIPSHLLPAWCSAVVRVRNSIIA
jgi:hypothetical protein